MGRVVKTLELRLDSFGSFLGMEKGCIVLRDRNGKTKRHPLFEEEIGEVVLQSGNLVSTGVLSALGFWQIDVLVTTRNGYPIAMLKNLEDDSHVKTRVCQYEALKNGKATYLARQFVIGKVEGQNILLNKYGLGFNDSVIRELKSFRDTDLITLRGRLLHLEGKYSEYYFRKIFGLFLYERLEIALFPKITREHRISITHTSFFLSLSLSPILSLTHTDRQTGRAF